MKSEKPNLFIVGVARAGTTSWHSYLKQHPEVFMSEEQRPNYFGDNQHRNDEYYNTEEKYLSLFKRVNGEKVIGESSHLFPMLTAPKEIKEFNPNSKIIIILRNPVEVIRSSVDVVDKVSTREFFTLLRRLLYFDNLKRWIDVFGKNKVHIMIFEDFVKNQKEEYYKVCDFLGIDKKFVPEFKRNNYAYKVHYPFWANPFFYLYARLPISIRGKVKDMFRTKREKIWDGIRKIEQGHEERTILSGYEKEQFLELFRIQINKTEELIGRKLDIWK